jgi:hypothetical protein
MYFYSLEAPVLDKRHMEWHGEEGICFPAVADGDR